MTAGFWGSSKASDIEHILAWTYHDQLANTLIEQGVGLLEAERRLDDIHWRRTSPDGVAACLRAALLGGRVDRSPYQSVLHIAHEAVVVHTMVMVLGPPLSDLIIMHAILRSRPDWRPDARFRYEPKWKMLPKWTEGGLPRPKSFEVVRQYFKKSNKVRTSWCPIHPVDDPQTIAEARKRYVVWHAGLAGLAEYFTWNPDLPHPTIGVGPPMCPWNGLK